MIPLKTNKTSQQQVLHTEKQQLIEIKQSLPHTISYSILPPSNTLCHEARVFSDILSDEQTNQQILFHMEKQQLININKEKQPLPQTTSYITRYQGA